MRLKDKIALVTGAAGDIGAATAKRFAEEGATVILCDINVEGCEKVLQEIVQKGCTKGPIIRADVTKEEDIVAMFSRIKTGMRTSGYSGGQLPAEILKTMWLWKRSAMRK